MARLCHETNAEGVRGRDRRGDARGRCLPRVLGRPGCHQPEWVEGMQQGAIVFACANPIPKSGLGMRRRPGAIVATGRSDYPNQVNNSLVFPGIFRGTLDVRARTISDEMAIAAARELARFAANRGMHECYIVPRMDEWEACIGVAVATALKAQEQGLARLSRTAEQLHEGAVGIVKQAARRPGS